MPPSHPRRPAAAPSVSSASRARWAWPFSTPPPIWGWGSPSSSPWATRPMSRATIWWSSGRTTPTPRSSACTSSRSATPVAFPRSPKRVSRKKPILIVKSGRTAEGARAASSHTGAIAGADVPVSAFLEQCGVLRANTIEELFAICQGARPLPPVAGQASGHPDQRRRTGDHGHRRLRQSRPRNRRS